jgi:hypothetical protein
MPMNFKQTDEFAKDFKHYYKRYKTLPDDMEELKKVLNIQPLGIGRNFAVITKQNNVTIIKARLFCRSLKRNSLRLIYAYELNMIDFIELYFKGDKEDEDRERIKRYLRG